MIDDAEERGFLYPHTGSRIFEGTSGSTGISIATIARARYVMCRSLSFRLIVSYHRGYEASKSDAVLRVVLALVERADSYHHA